MAVENLANEFTTTLDGAILSAATTLTLASTTGVGLNSCPAAPFRLRIDDELILVGARIGVTCASLTRGVEGTSAADHASGSTVRQILTVAGLQDHVNFGAVRVTESGAAAPTGSSASDIQVLAVAKDDSTKSGLGVLNTTFSTNPSFGLQVYQDNVGAVFFNANQGNTTFNIGPLGQFSSTDGSHGIHVTGNGDIQLQLEGSGEIRLDNIGNTFELVMSDATGVSLLGGVGVTIATLAGAHDITINAGRNLTVTAGGSVTIPSFTAAASMDVGAAGVRLAGSNGALTLLGLGNGTDEDLTINLNSANVATFSSSTGVVSAAFSGIALDSTLSIKSSGASSGVGYATGAGGASTQSTNKSTTVTASPNPSVCGSITMDAANLNAGTIVSFTFTNSAIAATDVLVLNHISGGTVGSYTLNAQCGAGSAVVNVRNNTAGNLAEAIVIQYALVKAVNA